MILKNTFYRNAADRITEYLMLKAPLRGFCGLVSVSRPGKEVRRKARYSLAILPNF